MHLGHLSTITDEDDTRNEHTHLVDTLQSLHHPVQLRALRALHLCRPQPFVGITAGARAVAGTGPAPLVLHYYTEIWGRDMGEIWGRYGEIR